LTQPSPEQPKTFVARVQVGYRIQIPEPLRIVMDIKEEDLVEIIIRKLEPKPEEKEKEPSTSSSP